MPNHFLRLCMGALLLCLIFLISDNPTTVDRLDVKSDLPVQEVDLDASHPTDGIPSGASLRFFANRGQLDSDYRFHVDGAHHTILFGPSAVVFHRRDQNNNTAFSSKVRLRFLNASPNPVLEGYDRLHGTANFYRGSDPSAWATGVPAYGGIRYRDLYPGIDLTYSEINGQLKREFIVAPGADPSLIRMEYGGMESIRISDAGELVFETPPGTLTEAAPVLYQEQDGRHIHVEGRFVLLREHTVGFEIGDFDATLPLVIDPEYSFLSYLGGSGTDNVHDLVVNGAGHIFAAGGTNSNDFPTANALQGRFAGGFLDLFITRIDPTDGTLMYSTFLGGSGDEVRVKIALDDEDNIYLAGETTSTDFPTLNAQQGSSGGGRDAVVAKLAPDGSLVFSTYLGGSETDRARGIGLDASNKIWVTGSTESADFPTTADALQGNAPGNGDGFVTRMSADGSALEYASYLGGDDSDNGNDLIIDDDGNVYVGGSTRSNGFADAELGGTAAYVLKLDNAGQRQGMCIADGPGADFVNALAVDDKYVYFSGAAGEGFLVTEGPDFAGGNRDGILGMCHAEMMQIASLRFVGTPAFDFTPDVALVNPGDTTLVISLAKNGDALT